ncbi:DNA modification system-associated small protein [Succinimonas sp.]|uniref:DNA modification system-associated small protein n=1 Tax=Succinimonas sp. TaxID=1936151 RepID=UPI00386919E7
MTTTTRKNLNELLEVLEEIRSKYYPDVPKELIEQIALTQYENQDDRNKARADTMHVIAKYVNKTE